MKKLLLLVTSFVLGFVLIGCSSSSKEEKKGIDVEKLDINMIDKINPFQRAYEIMSTNINSSTLRILQREIDSKKYDFSEDELRIIYPQILKFISENDGKLPDKSSDDEMERKYAYALIKLKTMKEKKERLENA